MYTKEQLPLDKKIRGYVDFDIFCRQSGKLLDRIERQNTVLEIGYPALLHGVLVNDYNYRIDRLKIGNDFGTGTFDNPQPASKLYTGANMSEVYETTTPLDIGFSDAATANISTTLDGEEVAGIGNNLDFCSAALVTANGTFFSYLRFPRISISDLINISVNWTLKV